MADKFIFSDEAGCFTFKRVNGASRYFMICTVAMDNCDISIDCTILEKSKAQPQTRIDDVTFYKYAWYYHLRKVGPILCPERGKTLITAASIGNKKKRSAFKETVNNVAQQIIPRDQWEVSFTDSSNDPCLWLADYCAWAIQRKWERDDDEFYKIIRSKIKSEYDLWEKGVHHYY